MIKPLKTPMPLADAEVRNTNFYEVALHYQKQIAAYSVCINHVLPVVPSMSIYPDLSWLSKKTGWTML